MFHLRLHLTSVLFFLDKDFDPNTIFQAFFGGGGFHPGFGGRRHRGGFPGNEYHFSFG
jgi:hypothetical protein